MIPRLAEIDLRDRTVFLRVDFNVPIDQGRIVEPHRIDSSLPTVEFILRQAKKVVIASHLGRPDGKVVVKYSLAPVRDYLERKLAQSVGMASDCVGAAAEDAVREDRHRVILLENLRFHKEEEANEEAFSRALASLADIYVNDAFGAAHRAHASISGMARFFATKAAGLLLQKELDYLTPVLTSPARPFVAILGGAKVSDKIGVIRNLLPKLDALLIGGGMAYTFLKSRGLAVGRSLVEEDKLTLATALTEESAAHGVKLLLPVDHVTGDLERKNPAACDEQIPRDRIGLDIGPNTVRRFAEELTGAKMVLWNGPVGLFEVPPYDRGSRALAQAVADRFPETTSIIAGGDTVAAVSAAGVQARLTHLSTGGGATLEFLEGKVLPGLRALEQAP